MLPSATEIVLRARPWLRRHALDLLLLTAALCFAAPALLYPFGRDHGLYHYVGREWLRGAVPYRDVMEQKTPVIFLVYGLAQALFGEHFWSVRVVEVAWVLTVGVALAAVATPRGERALPGMHGATALLVALAYFGTLDFWHTAQCEVGASGLAIVALALVHRRAPDPRATVVAGLLAGLAVLAKPTGALLALPVGVLAVARGFAVAPRLRGAVVTGLRFALGALAPFALFVAYLGVHRGALTAAYDVLVRCNAYYVANEAASHSRAEDVRAVATWATLHLALLLTPTLAALMGFGAAIGARSWALARRYGGALTMLVLATLGVVVQRKFFPYHWGAVLLWLPLPVALAADDLARGARLHLRSTALGAAFASALMLFAVTLPWRACEPIEGYQRRATPAWQYARGRIDRAAYLASIAIPHYDLAAQETIGRWLEAHTSPADTVALRNFEPAMYAVAHRRSPSRFFWTPWIAWNARAYRRHDWLAEDARALTERPPRYLVTADESASGPESAEYYLPDYQPVFRSGAHSVLARGTVRFDRLRNEIRVAGRLVTSRALGTFEGPDGLAGWELSGEAMQGQPRDDRPAPGQFPLSGVIGDRLLSTWSPTRGDAARGTALSPAWVGVASTTLVFMVGGGATPEVGVDLLVDGQTVNTWGGRNAESLRFVSVDLSPYAGRSLRVMVRDASAGAWGHLLADNFLVLDGVLP